MSACRKPTHTRVENANHHTTVQPHSTVMMRKIEILKKFDNLPRSGYPMKFMSCQIVLCLLVKNPSAPFQMLQASVRMLNGWFGRAERKKPLLSKMKTLLWFEKLHLNKSQHFWSNVLWTDGTKVEISDHNAQHHIWKPNTAYQHKHLKSTVKHSGWGVMIWTCFGAQDRDTSAQLHAKLSWAIGYNYM